MSIPARAAAATLLAIGLAGCETTEQKSAAIEKRLAGRRASTTLTRIGATSKVVKVLSAQLVHSAAGTAAALELRNTSSEARADVAIVIDVTDATGKSVFTNASAGASSPSGEISLIGPHATVWWVEANVLTSDLAPSHVSARVGRGEPAVAGARVLRATHLTSGSNFAGPFIGGRVVNGAAALDDVAVYTVAVADGHVLAAGQSLIPRLGGHATTSFQVNVIGSPRRARLTATIVPAHRDP
jgi:hypothetical protein